MSDILDYKIQGPLREPLLLLEWSIFFLFFELSLVFLERFFSKKDKLKYLEQQNRLKYLQEISYFFLFIGFSFSKLFYIIGDYYVFEENRMIFYTIAYIIQLIGIFLFIHILELYRNFYKKFLFTWIYITELIIFFIVIIFFFDLTQLFTYIFYPVFFVFILVFLRVVWNELYKGKEFGLTLSNLIILFIGIFALSLGFGLATDFAASIFGLHIRILGDILEIIGFLLLFLFFISIPSFSEFDWQGSIDSIYVTNKNGLYIFKYDFLEQPEEHLERNLAAGLLTSVKMVLQSFTKMSGITVLEKSGKTIIIFPGEYINGILICKDNLKSIRVLLEIFVKRLEKTFKNVFIRWKGDLTVFRPIENLVKEIFL